MSDKSSFLAEVIEGSLSRFKAQCWQSERVPTFGSLVVVEEKDERIFGLVQQVYVACDDPVRTIQAYQKTGDELCRDQPQIFAFIKTFFNVVIVGFARNNHLYQTLAPSPLGLHSFVRQATRDEYQIFFKEHYYLNLLFNQVHQIDAIDELLLALVHNFKEQNIFDAVIEDFIEQYSLLNSADYRRLKFFLARIENTI